MTFGAMALPARVSLRRHAGKPGPGQEPVLPTVRFRARCWFGACCAAADAAAAVAAADSTAAVPTLRRFDGQSGRRRPLALHRGARSACSGSPHSSASDDVSPRKLTARNDLPACRRIVRSLRLTTCSTVKRQPFMYGRGVSFSCAALMGCGGSSDQDSTSPRQAVSAGTITRCGSVTVNGVRFRSKLEDRITAHS